MTAAIDTPQASVNGVALHGLDEHPSPQSLRQRACTELLRQAAQAAGLLDADDPAPQGGVPSAAASAAIEALLDQALVLPTPDEAACQRHHAANAARYQVGERVRLRHILYAVTPGVDVNALRQRAEATLLDVRCHDGEHSRFGAAARRDSNCPSGAEGGELGWLTADDCAPEFAREVLGTTDLGVLPRVVHSRHGLHVVEVLAREPGQAQPFEAVRGAVAQTLLQHSYVTALRQYLRLLAGRAALHGVDLDAADSPLVQ